MKKHQKFLITSFTGVSLITLPIILASCSLKQKDATKETQIQLKFEHYETTKQLLNDIFNQQTNEISDYVFLQNNIFDQNLVDLKFSLTNFNPSHPRFPNSNANGIVSEIAKKTIFETMTNDWFWLLKNINELEYYFNPYDINRYIKVQNEDELFKDNDYLNKVITINNKMIQEIVVVNNFVNDYDYFQNQKTYYLKYDNNKVIRLIKFQKDNELRIRIDYDLYKFSSDSFNLNEFANAFENELTKIKNELYQKELNYLDKDPQTNNYDQQELDSLNQKFSNKNYFDLNKWTTYQEMIFSAYTNTKAKWDYLRYSLRNVKDHVIVKKQSDSNKKEVNVDLFIDNEFLKFIDHNKDINIKAFDKKQYETNKIINSLLDEQFLDNNQKIAYLNQQNNIEYQVNLINKFKEFANYFSYSDNKTKTPEIYQQKLNEYTSLFSNNWYFVLKHIDSFKGEFANWYLLPEVVDKKTNELLKMSDEYKQALINKDPYRSFYMVDNYLDKKQEGDNSVAIGDYKDFYITKNKAIINIRIDKQKNNQYTLNPLIYYFPEAKTNISINAITRIFHYALFHYDKRYYEAFEKELIKQYQYGIPAQMLLLWRY